MRTNIFSSSRRFLSLKLNTQPKILFCNVKEFSSAGVISTAQIMQTIDCSVLTNYCKESYAMARTLAESNVQYKDEREFEQRINPLIISDAAVIESEKLMRSYLATNHPNKLQELQNAGDNFRKNKFFLIKLENFYSEKIKLQPGMDETKFWLEPQILARVNLFSGLIGILNFKYQNTDQSFSPRMVKITPEQSVNKDSFTYKGDLNYHTDVAFGPLELAPEVTSLVGVQTPSGTSEKAVTTFLNTKNIYHSLSPNSRKILSKNIFIPNPNLAIEKPRKAIFTKGKDGKIEAQYYETMDSNIEDGKIALKELREKLTTLPPLKIKISGTDVIIFNNKKLFHARKIEKVGSEITEVQASDERLVLRAYLKQTSICR